MFPEILEFYPDVKTYIDRTTMNTWEHVNSHKAITEKNKKKIVLAGLWSEVCIVGPALSALAEGYEVYVKIVYGESEFNQLAPPKSKAIPEWSPVNFYGGYQYR